MPYTLDSDHALLVGRDLHTNHGRELLVSQYTVCIKKKALGSTFDFVSPNLDSLQFDGGIETEWARLAGVESMTSATRSIVFSVFTIDFAFENGRKNGVACTADMEQRAN